MQLENIIPEIKKIYKQCEPELTKIIKQCETVVRPLVALLAISYLIYQIHVLPLHVFLSVLLLTLYMFSDIKDRKGQDGLFYAVWAMTISVFILAFLPVPELLMSIIGIADAVFTIRYSAFKIIQLLRGYNGEATGQSSEKPNRKGTPSQTIMDANTPTQADELTNTSNITNRKQEKERRPTCTSPTPTRRL